MINSHVDILINYAYSYVSSAPGGYCVKLPSNVCVYVIYHSIQFCSYQYFISLSYLIPVSSGYFLEPVRKITMRDFFEDRGILRSLGAAKLTRK